MKLETFARTVLLGTTLEDKLKELSASDSPSQPLTNLPATPGRPKALSLDQQAKSKFPDLSQIHHPHVRGEILHFFANHELLALELMALLLLKFPEAPSSFRLGIARTMSEEQGHLKLYLERMRELGVSFGDIPVNGYFWHALSPMRSPLEFVTQMSLTFEQANLDFSLFYRDEISKTGDMQTTQVLNQVYREEIGHVRHGLEWFNRWRAEDPRASEGESDWDAYRRLLPPPLTPRRAKGVIFDVGARRQAGFSETYIRELELFSGAKGRPPVVWSYNPFCDAEIARGTPGFSPKSVPRRLAQDLEHLPMFLASPQDLVLTSKRPGLDWLTEIKQAGFKIPEWADRDSSKLREPKLGGFEPWGWSPESIEFFRPLASRLTHTSGGNAQWCKSLFTPSAQTPSNPFAELFSKAWSVKFLKDWIESHPDIATPFQCKETVGEVFGDWNEAKTYVERKLGLGQLVIVKAPWSTSGNGVRRILKAEELDSALGGWIQNIIREQGSVVLEPLLHKVHDLSIQIEIGDDSIQIFEARKFLTGNQFEYRGTLLGPLRDSFDSFSLRLLQEELPSWKAMARDLGTKLREAGYQGPVGIDAMIYRDSGEKLKLKPIVEINPRWTMGRVALELEKQILPGTPGAWIFIPARGMNKMGASSLQEVATQLKARFPLQLSRSAGSSRIESGALVTQDPAHSQEILTVLFVGPAAFQWVLNSGTLKNSSGAASQED